MLRVALTGGIATGKSHLPRPFRGARRAHYRRRPPAARRVAPGSPGLEAVAARFGPGVMQPDGTLDRAALAAIVFSDRTARAALEAIVHPEVRRRIREWFVSLPPQTPLAIADIPLLFETGQEHDFDRVIVCACDPAEQLRRLIARNGLSEEAARQRLAAQWPIAEKVARAHHVIRTDGTFVGDRGAGQDGL